MLTRDSQWWPLVALGVVGACTGTIDEGGPTPAVPGEAQPPPPVGGGKPGGGPGPAPGSGPGGQVGPGAMMTPGAKRDVGVAPFVRLSSAEYVHTVQDVFADLMLSLQAGDLPPDGDVAGFAGPSAQPLSPEDLARYADVAGTLGQSVADKADAALAPCNRAQTGDAACTRQFLAARLPRLWRRPVLPEEIDALMTRVFAPVQKDHGFALALEAVVTRALLSPSFLFKIERGTAAPELGPGVVRLDDRSLAVRLSSFLWRSAPDARLTDLAARGELARPTVLAAEVARMLDDPRGIATVRAFGRQWLHFDEEKFPGKSAYPDFNPSLRAQMFEEADRFFDHVLRKGGGELSDLFTARYTFATPALARLYGITGGGMDWPRVELAASQDRAGLLTLPLYLAQHSHFEDPRQAIHRGYFVRTRMLCDPVPPPPPDLDITGNVDRLAPGNGCSGCHLTFETIGRGFERFDGIGRYRETVDGKPIEARGIVRNLDGTDRTFSSVRELGDRLATSDQARTCLARSWLAFALGREVGPQDGSTLAAADQALAETKSVRRMIERLVTSDAFLHRRDEPAPACP